MHRDRQTETETDRDNPLYRYRCVEINKYSSIQSLHMSKLFPIFWHFNFIISLTTRHAEIGTSRMDREVPWIPLEHLTRSWFLPVDTNTVRRFLALKDTTDPRPDSRHDSCRWIGCTQHSPRVPHASHESSLLLILILIAWINNCCRYQWSHHLYQ